MKLSADDLWRLNHMLLAIADIEECVKKRHLDPLIQYALEKLITNIGEMARSVSPTLKQQYADIPWPNIVAMRNMLVHEYHKIDKETVWPVAEHKIPALKDWIIGIIEAHEKTN